MLFLPTKTLLAQIRTRLCLLCEMHVKQINGITFQALQCWLPQKLEQIRCRNSLLYSTIIVTPITRKLSIGQACSIFQLDFHYLQRRFQP
ncbi:hypothetical protein ASF91_13530 [Rhizobium sp. Leaf155]|nr:hypothetical protein ASF91_13530 [Rhizobium sp. Leaf155]